MILKERVSRLYDAWNEVQISRDKDSPVKYVHGERARSQEKLTPCHAPSERNQCLFFLSLSLIRLSSAGDLNLDFSVTQT